MLFGRVRELGLARRTRSAPSLSTTRTSPSTSEVTCTQNNMVNPAEELVNRRWSPTDVMKHNGKEVGGGIFVMMDATRMVDNYHMCWTGIRAPALNIGLE